MSGHSKLAPSAGARWINCPGSVALCKDIPNTTSVYAEEGTEAHSYAAWLLNGAKPPVPKASEEMVSFVSVYTAAIRRAAEGKILLVEQRLDLSTWTTEVGGGGTADAIIVDEPNQVIEVHDLKYGMGHLVDADNNEQLMLYGLGALELIEALFGFEVKEVKLVIHQPRRDHMSEWTISRSSLLDFGYVAQIRGSYALNGEGALNPSEKACLWCPAKTTCPALAKSVNDAVMQDFTEFPETSSTPQPSKYPSADTLELVELWLKSIKQAIFEKLQNNEPVEGWKLVAGRSGNRAWIDEAVVESLVRQVRLKKAMAYNTVLKSPAQLEKNISKMTWKQFEQHIGRSDPKPQMAPASDPRPAFVMVSAEEFDIFR